MKKRIAFKMFLKPGFESEYERRHREIWPELVELLRKSGVSNYSIHFDKSSNQLFAFQEQDSEKEYDISTEPVMRKWWEYMADIMLTNKDHSPIVVQLDEVFFMA